MLQKNQKSLKYMPRKDFISFFYITTQRRAFRIVHNKYYSSLHELIELDKITIIHVRNIDTLMIEICKTIRERIHFS